MKISTFDAFVLSVSPIFMTYKFFIQGVSIAESLMAASLLLHLVSGSLLRIKRLPLILFVFSIVLLHLLATGIMGDGGLLGYFRLAKFLIIIAFIAAAFERVDRNILASFVLFFVSLNIGIMLLQYVIKFVSGAEVLFLLPLLPLVNSDISIASLNSVLAANFRPAALFLEPAHLSYYLFFSACFLYRFNIERTHIILPLICLALIGTFSSFGFFSSLFLFALIFRKINVKVRVLGVFIFTVCIAFAASSLLEKIPQIPQIARLIDPESVAVTGRLSGGEDQFQRLSQFNQAWGLGFGNFKLDGFANAVNYLRLSFGAKGMYIMLALLLPFLSVKYNNILHYALLVGISFFTSLLLTPFLLSALLPLFTETKVEKR